MYSEREKTRDKKIKIEREKERKKERKTDRQKVTSFFHSLRCLSIPGSSVALVLSQDVSLDEREQFEILLDYYAYVEDSVNRLEVTA